MEITELQRLRIGVMLPSLDPSGGVTIALKHCSTLAKISELYVILSPNRINDVKPETLSSLNTMGISVTTVDKVDIAFDLVFFTFWTTVLEAMHWPIRSKNWIHFCQSLEDRFLADPENIDLHNLYLAQYVYSLPLDVVTEASWIADALKGRIGRPINIWKLTNPLIIEYKDDCIDLQDRINKNLIAVIEGESTWLKGVDLALTVAENIQDSRIEFNLLTGTNKSSSHHVQQSKSKIARWGRVGRPEFQRILSESDVLIKMSFVEGMYGPPLEGFRFKTTTITSDVTGSEEYIKHMENAIVVGLGDTSGLSFWLKQLAIDHSLLDELKNGAFETSLHWPTDVFIETELLKIISGMNFHQSSSQLLSEYLTDKELFFKNPSDFLKIRRKLSSSLLFKIRRLVYLIKLRDWISIKRGFKRLFG